MKEHITKQQPRGGAVFGYMTNNADAATMEVLEAARRALVKLDRPSKSAFRRYLGVARAHVLASKAIDLGRAFLTKNGAPGWLRCEREAPDITIAEASARAAAIVYKSEQARRLGALADRRVESGMDAFAMAMECFRVAAAAEGSPGFGFENVAVAQYASGRRGRARSIWRQILVHCAAAPSPHRLAAMCRSNLAALALDESKYHEARDLLDVDAAAYDGELTNCIWLNRAALAIQTGDGVAFHKNVEAARATAPSLDSRRFAEGRIQNLILQFYPRLTASTVDALRRTVFYE
ncbi:MAG: hypothetical protein HY286_15900 [Planctomycetes bacterium]|nr:hypothetical protein [Planctomycetota bacterium]